MADTDFIKYAKKLGILISKDERWRVDYQTPIVKGIYILNDSKARLYVTELYGYIIIYVEETKP